MHTKLEDVATKMSAIALNAREVSDAFKSIGDVNIKANIKTSTASTTSSSSKEESKTDASEQKMIRLQTRIDNWNAKCETQIRKLTSMYGDMFNVSEYEKLYRIQDKIDDVIKEYGYDSARISEEFAKATREVKKFESNLSASKKEIVSLNKEAQLLNTSLGRFIQFYAFGEVFRGVKTLGVNMFETIKDVDTSMVELKKVTDETAETYSKFLDSSATKAKELGIAMTDYIDSVTNFARMDVGGFEAAQQVAEVANIFQQVSESLTADQASEYLISTMKAFGYEANNAIEIVDVLNNLDRGFYMETYRFKMLAFIGKRARRMANSEDKTIYVMCT